MTAATMAMPSYSDEFFDSFKERYGGPSISNRLASAFTSAVGEGFNPLRSVAQILAKPLNWFKGLWAGKDKLVPHFAGAACGLALGVGVGLNYVVSHLDFDKQPNHQAGMNEGLTLAKEEIVPATVNRDVLAPLTLQGVKSATLVNPLEVAKVRDPVPVTAFVAPPAATAAMSFAAPEVTQARNLSSAAQELSQATPPVAEPQSVEPKTVKPRVVTPAHAASRFSWFSDPLKGLFQPAVYRVPLTATPEFTISGAAPFYPRAQVIHGNQRAKPLGPATKETAASAPPTDTAADHKPQAASAAPANPNSTPALSPMEELKALKGLTNKAQNITDAATSKYRPLWAQNSVAVGLLNGIYGFPQNPELGFKILQQAAHDFHRKSIEDYLYVLEHGTKGISPASPQELQAAANKFAGYSKKAASLKARLQSRVAQPAAAASSQANVIMPPLPVERPITPAPAVSQTASSDAAVPPTPVPRPTRMAEATASVKVPLPTPRPAIKKTPATPSDTASQISHSRTASIAPVIKGGPLPPPEGAIAAAAPTATATEAMSEVTVPYGRYQLVISTPGGKAVTHADMKAAIAMVRESDPTVVAFERASRPLAAAVPAIAATPPPANDDLLSERWEPSAALRDPSHG